MSFLGRFHRTFISALITIVLLQSCTRSQDEGMYTSYSYDYTANDQDIHAYISHLPDVKSYPLVLFLHGAGCGTLSHIHTSTRRYFDGENIGILTVDKPGAYTGMNQIFSMIHCSDTFKKNNYPSARAESVLFALDKLKDEKTGWNGDLFIVSAHEGALSAAMISQKMPVKGIVVLGSGDGFADADAFQILGKCVSSADMKCDEIKGSEKTVRSIIEKDVHTRSNYRGIWGNGMWWHEMLSLKVSDLLENVASPVHIVHTGRDTTIEKESAKRLFAKLQSMNKNVSIKIYEDLDGGFMDQHERSNKHQVQLDIASWIKSQISNRSK